MNAYKDRQGKMRYYFRRSGQQQIPLVGRPGTRIFARSYEAAVRGKILAARPIKAILKPRIGHVYFLSDGQNIKIGFTTDWSRRQRSYRTHNSRELTLLVLCTGFRSDEAALHRRFGEYRIEKTEWFIPGPRLMHHIKETIEEHRAA